jgi:hypothetical protein
MNRHGSIKTILILLLQAVFLFSLIACDARSDSETGAKNENQAEIAGTGVRSADDERGIGKMFIYGEPNWLVDANPNILLTLFGMNLRNDKQDFLQTFGSPQHEYFTEGDEESLFVLEFTDFDVGFDSSGRAVFINVTSATVDPALNGVKIGSAVRDVIERLGQPSLSGEYVLTYSKNGHTLKFDLNPEEQEVISIKLFENP